MHTIIFVIVITVATLIHVVTAIKYSSSSTEVEVTATIIDANNSTKKCITYLSNKPEKYTTACFTTKYTDLATFNECAVQFDNQQTCDKCSVCQDANEKTGFEIDCDALLPSKSTINDVEPCTILSDANIQAVLTDDTTTTFATTPFDFTISPTVTDDSDMTTKNNTDDKQNTSGISTINEYTICKYITALSMMLTVTGTFVGY
jgi:hypothetical protein